MKGDFADMAGRIALGIAAFVVAVVLALVFLAGKACAQTLDSEPPGRIAWDGRTETSGPVAAIIKAEGFAMVLSPAQYERTLDRVEIGDAAATEAEHWKAVAIAEREHSAELAARVATLEAERTRLADALGLRTRELELAERKALRRAHAPAWHYVAAFVLGWGSGDAADFVTERF